MQVLCRFDCKSTTFLSYAQIFREKSVILFIFGIFSLQYVIPSKHSIV
jgi:hypothetical protein